MRQARMPSIALPATNTPTSCVPCQLEERPSFSTGPVCAAQTSHATYIIYRERLFHFGCKSTTDHLAAGHVHEAGVM